MIGLHKYLWDELRGPANAEPEAQKRYCGLAMAPEQMHDEFKPEGTWSS